jgi:hypothetical protein
MQVLKNNKLMNAKGYDMKTLTVNHREGTAEYRGRRIFDCNIDGVIRNISDIEWLANDLGFTHIRWLRLPIGSGNTKCRIKGSL